MLSILAYSNNATLPARRPPLPPKPKQWVNGYQVSGTHIQNIQPVKRDKSRCSITASERTNLWQRFKNINLTDYHCQNNIILSAKTTASEQDVQGTYRSILRKPITPAHRQAAIKKSVSFSDNMPEKKSIKPDTQPGIATQGNASRTRPADPVIYDIPRTRPIPAHYDIPRAIPIPAHYDLPRAIPIPAHYDLPRVIPIPAHYALPRVIPAHHKLPLTGQVSWFLK